MNGHDHGDDFKIVDDVPFYTVNSATYVWCGFHIMSSEELREKYGYLNGYLLYKQAFCVDVEIDDKEIINDRMNDFINRRKDKQPLSFPSAGSTFKRTPDNFAGALIEKSGLKGFSIGGAQVSEKHAGFVVNKGNATCNDVVLLMSHIVKTVQEQHGVTLEPEIIKIGR